MGSDVDAKQQATFLPSVKTFILVSPSIYLPFHRKSRRRRRPPVSLSLDQHLTMKLLTILPYTLLFAGRLQASSASSSTGEAALRAFREIDYRFFVAGGTCAAISHGITTPIDVVKTRIQANPKVSYLTGDLKDALYGSMERHTHTLPHVAHQGHLKTVLLLNYVGLR